MTRYNHKSLGDVLPVDDSYAHWACNLLRPEADDDANGEVKQDQHRGERAL
jgi:hypothetical protein